jgi:hypothetical protein
MMFVELTAEEEIAKHYKSAMSSVNLINNGQPEYVDDEDWVGILERNKGHLEATVAETFWTDEDMTPFTDAINS